MVLYMLDAQFAILTDGDTRKLDHLKKKKIIHLESVPVRLEQIIRLYEQNQLKDSDVRKALKEVREQREAAQQGKAD